MQGDGSSNNSIVKMSHILMQYYKNIKTNAKIPNAQKMKFLSKDGINTINQI